MALSAVNSSLYDLSGLTAQIADSVRNIKAQSLSIPEALAQDKVSASPIPQNYSINSFAVSYLEPNSLYSLQRILSEAPEELPEQNRRNQLRPNAENNAENPQINSAEVESLGFDSELETVFASADYAKATSIYRQAYTVNVPEVTLLFGGTPPAEDPSQYAATAYGNAANLNKNTQPLIELMHENNRNFDYTI